MPLCSFLFCRVGFTWAGEPGAARPPAGRGGGQRWLQRGWQPGLRAPLSPRRKPRRIRHHHWRPSSPPHTLGSPGRHGVLRPGTVHSGWCACPRREVTGAAPGRGERRGGLEARNGAGPPNCRASGRPDLGLRGRGRCDQRPARGDRVANGRLAGLRRGPPRTSLGSG